MCGIIGYIGKKEANPILIKGLEQLEYRGYDSAGICTIFQNSLQVHKKKGRVENIKTNFLPGNIGLGHTRWSTHGKPADHNAHPFVDQSQQFAVVHNGIIENYLELKEELRQQGVIFTSETDSEVIVHLISQNYTDSLQGAVAKTIPLLRGAYAFCVINKDTREIIGARNGSPLIVGLGAEEHFLASDVSAVIEHTKKVIYLNDFEIVRITDTNAEIYNFQGEGLPPNVKEVHWDVEQAQKQGFKHFMLKEIFEQPSIVAESLKI